MCGVRRGEKLLKSSRKEYWGTKETEKWESGELNGTTMVFFSKGRREHDQMTHESIGCMSKKLKVIEGKRVSYRSSIYKGSGTEVRTWSMKELVCLISREN